MFILCRGLVQLCCALSHGIYCFFLLWCFFFFFQAEDGIRDVERSRGLGDVYKRQVKQYLPSEFYLRESAQKTDIKKSIKRLNRLNTAFVIQARTYLLDSVEQERKTKEGREVNQESDLYRLPKEDSKSVDKMIVNFFPSCQRKNVHFYLSLIHI
eukprot:TRINITY_DN38341_c0_g1_i1.p1 TRINITY_DN38341_c0_g1~~TRINITY_DN38341_c0_g1_i1.p1  ORF type:complete len:155 (-),score=22.42 TRINITY_DN38341_c0_g1_i1:175-639(-)